MAFCVPSYGFDCNIKLSCELAESIRDFAPTHVVMALGSPKSEIWIHQHSAKLGDCHVLCVGAAVEFSLGLKKRAPSWVRATGFEWLFRFATEPRRLFRRYFWDSFGFFAAVLTDLRTRGTSVV
jgi:N-acetylglucosaminyldiphosphoundecaprenol N-acetyl-beta-D-mannosaminyltransferase